MRARTWSFGDLLCDGLRPGVTVWQGRHGRCGRTGYYVMRSRASRVHQRHVGLGNEYRSSATMLAEKMGAFVKQCDPTSISPLPTVRRFPLPPIAMATLRYIRAGTSTVLRFHAQEQGGAGETGRVIPQVNEEYGYEITILKAGARTASPRRSAETRARIAWKSAWLRLPDHANVRIAPMVAAGSMVAATTR